MGNFEPRLHWFRRLADQSLKGVPVPGDKAFGRRLFLHHFLARGHPLSNADVLDHVLGSLGHDAAFVVKSLPARPPGDLLKVSHAENSDFFSVVLAQLGEEDGPNRNVDPDAERIRSTDDFKQTGLGQLLHPETVSGQKTRVMQPQTVTQELLE